MSRKPYAPICTFDALIKAHQAIAACETATDLIEVMKIHGPKCGHKAFNWIATGKATPWQMKPDDGFAWANTLDEEEQESALMDILETHPDHTQTKEALGLS